MRGARPLRVPLAGLLLAVLTQPALAQGIPGGHPSEAREQNLRRQAEFREWALAGANALLRRWTGAWDADEVRRISGLYTEDALLLSAEGPAPVRGVEQIGSHYESLLPGVGEIQVVLHDFDAGGTFAYVLGRFSYTPIAGSGSAGAVRGNLLFVLRRQNNDYRIRSQVFEVDG